jgi:4-amino-4-deoxychorismate lyase
MHDDALIDGVAARGGWLSERAFQFGDGLFETIAVIDREPCLWRAHLARLEQGCSRLRLPPPDRDRLAAECAALCAHHLRGVLKLYWTAGRSMRGYRRPVPVQPRYYLSISDWPYAEPPRDWTVRLCGQRLGENPQLAQIKHLNRLDQVIARAEWDQTGIDEGLMCGQDGRVVCGTMSNLYVQRGERLLTPALDGAGIAGVVRGLALELAAAGGFTLETGHVSLGAVRDADALYLSNSLIGVVRVRRFEGRVYDAGLPEHPLMTQTRAACHRPERLQ